MALAATDIYKIAQLARLAVPEADIPRYTQQLSTILAMIEQMQQVDTTAITPMAHPHDRAQRLRPDAVTETDQRARWQAIAPQVENGLYLVPQVIE